MEADAGLRLPALQSKRRSPATGVGRGEDTPFVSKYHREITAWDWSRHLSLELEWTYRMSYTYKRSIEVRSRRYTTASTCELSVGQFMSGRHSCELPFLSKQISNLECNQSEPLLNSVVYFNKIKRAVIRKYNKMYLKISIIWNYILLFCDYSFMGFKMLFKENEHRYRNQFSSSFYGRFVPSFGIYIFLFMPFQVLLSDGHHSQNAHIVCTCVVQEYDSCNLSILLGPLMQWTILLRVTVRSRCTFYMW